MTQEQLQLEAGEHIVIQVRKHWFLLSLQILNIFILGVLPIFFASILKSLPVPLIQVSLSYPILISLYSAWLVILWMLLFSIWTNYYLDVWTITNKRVIAVDQRGFFFRNTASFRLERVQDVIVSVNGIIATMFNYGSLEIQNASEINNFIAHGLPNPAGIKSLIFNGSDPVRREVTATATHTGTEV